MLLYVFLDRVKERWNERAYPVVAGWRWWVVHWLNQFKKRSTVEHNRIKRHIFKMFFFLYRWWIGLPLRSWTTGTAHPSHVWQSAWPARSSARTHRAARSHSHGSRTRPSHPRARTVSAGYSARASGTHSARTSWAAESWTHPRHRRTWNEKKKRRKYEMGKTNKEQKDFEKNLKPNKQKKGEVNRSVIWSQTLWTDRLLFQSNNSVQELAVAEWESGDADNNKKHNKGAEQTKYIFDMQQIWWSVPCQPTNSPSPDPSGTKRREREKNGIFLLKDESIHIVTVAKWQSFVFVFFQILFNISPCRVGSILLGIMGCPGGCGN